MNSKKESMMSGLAAMLLLFTTMLNPLISAGLAIVFLIAYSVYKYPRSTKR